MKRERIKQIAENSSRSLKQFVHDFLVRDLNTVKRFSVPREAYLRKFNVINHRQQKMANLSGAGDQRKWKNKNKTLDELRPHWNPALYTVLHACSKYFVLCGYL